MFFIAKDTEEKMKYGNNAVGDDLRFGQHFGSHWRWGNFLKIFYCYCGVEAHTCHGLCVCIEVRGHGIGPSPVLFHGFQGWIQAINIIQQAFYPLSHLIGLRQKNFIVYLTHACGLVHIRVVMQPHQCKLTSIDY